MVRTIAEALGIFSVSMIVLFAFYAISTKHATGIGWVHWKGAVLICVGLLYVVCGAVLMRLGK
jgi:hypothetical protein